MTICSVELLAGTWGGQRRKYGVVKKELNIFVKHLKEGIMLVRFG